MSMLVFSEDLNKKSCDLNKKSGHVTIINVSEKLLILSIFSANLKQNNTLFGNGSILFYSYVF